MMALDLDSFPLYDDFLKKDQRSMSDVWKDFMGTHIQTLQGYLSQNGIGVPRLTTEQRDELRDVDGGRIIYNTTLEKFQGYEGTPLAWVNLV